MQLEMALDTLRVKHECDELMFWGKVTGVTNDYYIAVAVTFKDMYEFPVKTFFWCISSDFTFKQLPSLSDQHDEAINKIEAYFMGEPNKVIISSKPEGEDEEEEQNNNDGSEEDQEEKEKDSDESEEEEIKVPKIDLTELDRLVTVVYAIENDC